MGYGNGGTATQAIGMGPLGGSGMIEKAARVNSLGDELSTQEKLGEALHAAISELETRLSPILRQTAPATETPGHPTPSASVVVDMLRRQGFRLDAAIERLHDLVQRAEI